MITIPLFAALIVFLLWMVIFFVFFLLNIYHLAKSAALTFTSFIFACLIAVSAMFILFGMWFLLSGTDWQAPIMTFTSFGF